MTIIEQLAKLAEAAPDVCRMESYPAKDYYGKEYRAMVFYVSGYKFFQEPNSDFEARLNAVSGCKGRPALAWLRDAIEAAIEARGWYHATEAWNDGVSAVKIVKTPTAINYTAAGDTLIEALLDALIKAVTK